MAEGRNKASTGSAARGREARRPSDIPAAGWKDIAWRVKDEISEDRLALVAAGVSFYLLLALFPALAALVSIYGLIADPQTVQDHVAALEGVLPAEGQAIIETQLARLARQNQGALGFGVAAGLLVAIWSANNGVKTLFQATNIAYDEAEQRGFVRLTLASLAFTIGGILLAIVFMVAVAVVPAVLTAAGLGAVAELLISLLRWPVLLIAAAAAIALLYRYGPSRDRPQWRWVTWGSAIATAVWVVGSALFSWYLSNFADYDATYGSLGAIIGLMMWLWISVFIVLVGAELNAEMEHQTSRDTTAGEEQPMGARGASMADTVGEAHEQSR